MSAREMTIFVGPDVQTPTPPPLAGLAIGLCIGSRFTHRVEGGPTDGVEWVVKGQSWEYHTSQDRDGNPRTVLIRKLEIDHYWLPESSPSARRRPPK